MILFSPYFIIKTLQWNALKNYSNFLKGLTLDMGCGVRPYRKYLTSVSEYVGMDENNNVNPDIVAKAERIPFGDNYFDSLLCMEVLEHLPEPETALKEIYRVLKKEGYVFISVPQEWPLHYEPNDFFRFTKYGIEYLLKKNNFEIIAALRIGGIFSLIGQRIVDLLWRLLVRILRPVCGARFAEKTASLCAFPWSLLFYFLAILGDRIESGEALGWVVLARK